MPQRLRCSSHSGWRGRHAAGEQIEREPAALVLELGLAGERRRRMRASEVFRLHELRVRSERGGSPPSPDVLRGPDSAWREENAASSRACGYHTPYSALKRAVVSGSLIGV